MHSTLVHIHSILRWIILLTGIWAFVRALKGANGKTPYVAADNKASLFFSISLDIQFLIGLILMFISPWVTFNMKEAAQRFFSVEHPLMALIALVLVHIGRSKVKKSPTDALKHKRALIFYGLALLIILAMIPWPFRTALGRGWI
jgi:uncharacterized Tic20 family protein